MVVSDECRDLLEGLDQIGCLRHESVATEEAQNAQKVRVPLLRPSDIFLLVNFALTFFDRHDPVHSDAGDLIDHAAGPTHLDRIYLCSLLETEMQSQIALRDVTVATSHFVYLRQVA